MTVDLMDSFNKVMRDYYAKKAERLERVADGVTNIALDLMEGIVTCTYDSEGIKKLEALNQRMIDQLLVILEQR